MRGRYPALCAHFSSSSNFSLAGSFFYKRQLASISKMSSQNLPPRLKESLEASKCEHRQLGKSGLRISVPIFGCMSFGDRRTLPWVIGEDEMSGLNVSYRSP